MKVTATEIDVRAGQLRPGDWVAEYGGLAVAAVRASERRAMVTEVEFVGDPMTRFLHGTEVLHVTRPDEMKAQGELSAGQVPKGQGVPPVKTATRVADGQDDETDVFNLRKTAARDAARSAPSREDVW